MLIVPFFPVDRFGPQQLLRNTKNPTESAIAEKMVPLAQFVDDCQETDNKYKIYLKMSFKLETVSKKVQKGKNNRKGLDKLQKQLKNAEFYAG